MGEGKVSLSLVAARITAVSGIGIAAAIGVLLLVGGIWLHGLIALLVALLFLGLMFWVERWAERH